MRDVAKAGAEYFQELLDARTVSISMHEDDQYRELVNIGYLPPPDSWYPAESVYPDSLFPLATQDLHGYGGYSHLTLMTRSTRSSSARDTIPR